MKGLPPGPCCFDPFSGQEVEGEAELRFKLVLPLLHQAAGGDDEGSVPESPRSISSRMSRPAMMVLPAPGVVGEQEA